MANKQLGLSRAEILWTAALVTFVVVLIVNTLHAEVARAKQRMCIDSLSYLSAQLHIGLEQQHVTTSEQLDIYYVGDGFTPQFAANDATSPISILLSPEIECPPDPWGRSFVLHKLKSGELWIISAGGKDYYPDQPFTKLSLAKRVHLPYLANQ
ncbi:MAG: hypothetical protein H8E25_09190 [Planctomycetes bacterium]|nr:hypothetical protein [Planctomycetota bacterium]